VYPAENIAPRLIRVDAVVTIRDADRDGTSIEFVTDDTVSLPWAQDDKQYCY
jgi:hypothetical protein